ncbi:hypothetical protein AGMMS49975_15820 [Clostridia bacterium]|nr:hypothetical protein AGMMS49975_15820 [Clostridia bacterium]
MTKDEKREYPRFKPTNDLNYYEGDFACIHAKFGDFRKCYNFPKDFREKYPNFCAEYAKYWEREDSVFKCPMMITNYIERFGIPCKLYSNMYDREFADFDAVREWICCERFVDYDFGEGKQCFKDQSMDGEPQVERAA